MVHVDDVLVCGLVTVIRLNDLVHEGSEVIVRFVRTSINTNTRVGPLGTGEDRLLEGVAVLVFTVLALLPDIAGKAFVEERAGTGREVRETGDIVRRFEVRSHHGAVEVGIGHLKIGNDELA